uniref:Uncharacterized protein n=1 Tax=Quercus lobata TaxID=97700 RepID=A0A7N2MU48_QUELO
MQYKAWMRGEPGRRLGQDYVWRWLRGRPTRPNECPRLELPGFSSFADSSHPYQRGVADWLYCGGKERISDLRAVLTPTSMWLFTGKATEGLGKLLNSPKQINLKPEREDDTNSVFSSGLELANFVVSLDVLHDAWTAIWNLYTEISQNEGPSSLVKFKVFELPNFTIIAFFTWPANSKDYL